MDTKEFKRYTDEEITELLDSGEAKVEDRRFSSSVDSETEMRKILKSEDFEGNEAETREFASVNLNLKAIIGYMSMDVKNQFRFLMMSVKKYIRSLKPDTSQNEVNAVITYVSSELTRMIMIAKKQMLQSGGNLNTILGLSRVGSGEITRLGMQLSKIINKVNHSANGALPRNLTAQVDQYYNLLIKAILEKLGIDKLQRGGGLPVVNEQLQDRIIMQSLVGESDDSSIVVIEEPKKPAKVVGIDETTEFYINDLDSDDLDVIEEFIENLDVGAYSMDYDNGLLKVSFFDPITDEKMELFKRFIEHEN
nr:MAG TPA: hypothetical protein [Bacteriophage sp.]DAS09658.1 MAG TPA: hypothetical protein [Bacteriophage sp.]